MSRIILRPPAFVLFGAIWCAAGLLDSSSAADTCFAYNNDRRTLSTGEVYQNGKFKFMIEAVGGWTAENIIHARGITRGYPRVSSVKVRSNAERINGEYYRPDRDHFTRIANKDTTLCPGIEISMDCGLTMNGQNWDCKFTEF